MSGPFSSSSVGTLSYFELDFKDVTQRKARAISSNEQLLSLLGECPQVDTHAGSVKSSNYNLFPCDIRKIKEVSLGLQIAGLDLSSPCFVLSECALIYLEESESESLILWFGENLKGPSAVCLYEQIHPNDPFGR